MIAWETHCDHRPKLEAARTFFSSWVVVNKQTIDKWWEVCVRGRTEQAKERNN